jgi:hypothetical protein
MIAPACFELDLVKMLERGKTYVKPASQHPRTVLVDLQAFDVDVTNDKADEDANADEAYPHLYV